MRRWFAEAFGVSDQFPARDERLFEDRTNLSRYYRCGTVEELHLTSTNNRREESTPARHSRNGDNVSRNSAAYKSKREARSAAIFDIDSMNDRYF